MSASPSEKQNAMTGASRDVAGSSRDVACNVSTDRRTDLAKIHLYKKNMGLDDDSYRDMLEQLTGKRSAALLSQLERKTVIAYLARHYRKKTYKGRPHNADHTPQIKKIEALLAEAGYPWSYAVAIAQQQCNKQKLEFCSSAELNAVINALIANAKKNGRYLP